MNPEEFKKNYRIIVEKIFNNWQDLRLAVEHGMGGRNGQKVRFALKNNCTLTEMYFSNYRWL